MAVTITWKLQGVTPTTIGTTDILQFAGPSGFNNPVIIEQYQDTMHVKSSGGSNLSSANTPNNVKFISATGGTGGDSQADWGDGTEDIDQITNAESTLDISVSESFNITVSDAVLYSYEQDGDLVDPAPDIVLVAFEKGDTHITVVEGSGSPLELNDSLTPATTHHFYISLSKTATAIGLKPDTMRFEAVVS